MSIILFFAKEIKDAFNDGSLLVGLKPPILIRWLFPPAGCFKINADGSAKGNSEAARFEGMIRNDQGRWLLGYLEAMSRHLV